MAARPISHRIAAGLAASMLLGAVDALAVEAPLFVDVTAQSGLSFRHVNGMRGDFHMIENLGAGVALIDHDSDGDLDLYLPQGHPLPVGKERPSDRLFRNDGPGADAPIRFTDVTAAAGLGGATGYGMGVATADVNGDGRVDLYVTNWGANQLFLNAGEGRFEDVTATSGAGDPGWSVPAVFLDHDRDGDLDLFVGNYLEYSLDLLKVCRTPAGARDYCAPEVYTPGPDRLYRNDGSGVFTDVTEAAGLKVAPAPTLGAVAADFDGDGWLDLYVANDQQPNRLWINRRDGSFEERALLAGVAVNEQGLSEASMGIATAVLDRGGFSFSPPSLFLTHLRGQTHTLYRVASGELDGMTFYGDATARSGFGAPSRATGFGTGFVDADLDGDEDLVIVNGAVRTLEALASAGDPFPFHEPNELWLNTGRGRFRNATAGAGGAAFAPSEVSRGLALGDLDGDGVTDLVVTNNAGPARILLGTAEAGDDWLGLALVGAKGAPAQGAGVVVHLDDGTLREGRAASDGSYASANDPRIRIAGEVGDSASVCARWPDGALESWTGVPTGGYRTLRRGTGVEDCVGAR